MLRIILPIILIVGCGNPTKFYGSNKSTKRNAINEVCKESPNPTTSVSPSPEPTGLTDEERNNPQICCSALVQLRERYNEMENAFLTLQGETNVMGERNRNLRSENTRLTNENINLRLTLCEMVNGRPCSRRDL